MVLSEAAVVLEQMLMSSLMLLGLRVLPTAADVLQTAACVAPIAATVLPKADAMLQAANAVLPTAAVRGGPNRCCAAHISCCGAPQQLLRCSHMLLRYCKHLLTRSQQLIWCSHKLLMLCSHKRCSQQLHAVLPTAAAVISTAVVVLP